VSRLVYFADPDVFFPGYDALRSRIKARCLALDIHPLFPGDSEIGDPSVIFRENIAMIAESDAVIANVNPFRSTSEPDSGTVFECGVAWSKGIPLILVCTDMRKLKDKVSREVGQTNFQGRSLDPDGALIEDFGYPLNLMLWRAAYAVASKWEEAILIAAKMSSPT